MGVTVAVLKSEGTVPDESEEWIIADMRGSREEEQVLTRVVGRGSSWHVVGFDRWMRSEISEAVGRRKPEKRWQGGGGSGGERGDELWWSC